MMWIIIIFDVHYDYFRGELLSLMLVMTILDVKNDGICSYFCLCDVYFMLILQVLIFQI